MKKEVVTFSDKFSGKILCKYLAAQYEGLAYFEITSDLFERIRIMRDLAILADGHIDGFCSVHAKLPETIDCKFFIPNLTPEFLSSNKYFLDTVYESHVLWYLDNCETEQLKKDVIIPFQGAFIEVWTDCFSIRVVPYENLYFETMAFTYRISMKAIGL